MTAHPFADIRDGSTGGADEIEEALNAFRLGAPTDPREPDGWPATRGLADALRVIFGADGPLVAIAEAGAERGVEMAAEVDAVALRGAPVLREVYGIKAVDPETLTPEARLRAARWAIGWGVEIIGSEVGKTLRAARTIATRWARGNPIDKAAAKDLVAVRGFGLNEPMTEQMFRNVRRWRAEGANQRTVRKRARALFGKLLTRRAGDLWQWVKRSAIYEGARRSWEAGVALGQIDPRRRLVWSHVGTRPGHPCVRCRSLIGTEVGISDDFVGDPIEGGTARENGRVLTQRRPPLHGHCDCFLRIQ